MTTQPEVTHAEQQAKSQLESIVEMVAALNAAGDDDTAMEEAQQTIQEDPLSVQVRSGWYSASSLNEQAEPVEFEILLCTGGPAVRIIGELDQFNQPENPRIQYQDWGTPWTDYHHSHDDALLTYCQQFWFGE